MKKVLILSALFAIIAISSSYADEIFKVDDTVPQFQLPYATKDTIDFNGIGSKDLKGQRYILAFYPADWSSGCTKEMCTFRDEFTGFENLNVEILAVSGDNVFSHQEWAKHNNLSFKLLADQTREFGKTMGVYRDKSGMFQRSVFVVGPDGRFEYIDYEYSVTDDKDFQALMNFLGEKR